MISFRFKCVIKCIILTIMCFIQKKKQIHIIICAQDSWNNSIWSHKKTLINSFHFGSVTASFVLQPLNLYRLIPKYQPITDTKILVCCFYKTNFLYIYKNDWYISRIILHVCINKKGSIWIDVHHTYVSMAYSSIYNIYPTYMLKWQDNCRSVWFISMSCF